MKTLKLIRLLLGLLLVASAGCELEEQTISQSRQASSNSDDVRPLDKTFYAHRASIQGAAYEHIRYNNDWEISEEEAYIFDDHINGGNTEKLNSIGVAIADLTSIADRCALIGSTYTGLITLNWEGKAFENLQKSADADAAKYNGQAQEFVKAIKKVKELCPNAKVNVYGLPFSNYYPTHLDKRSRNLPTKKFTPIFQEVHFISPSLYLQYPDYDNVSDLSNAEFLTQNLDSALRKGEIYGKPVIPFFWWRISTSVTLDRYKPGYFLYPAKFAEYTNLLLTYTKNGRRASGIVMWDAQTAKGRQCFNRDSNCNIGTGSPGLNWPNTSSGTSWVAAPKTAEEYNAIVIQEMDAINACFPISTLPCDQVKKTIPVNLYFRESIPNSIVDKNGLGTGFTMVDAYTGTRNSADGSPSNVNVRGYEKTKLTLNISSTTSALQLVTNKGIASGTNNNQINALGVEVDSRSRLKIETILVNPYKGTEYQQAGVWFGVGDNTYLKLVVVGDKVELRREINNTEGTDASNQRFTGSISGLNTTKVYLRMVIDPATNTAEGFYSIDGGITYVNVAGAAYTTKTLSISTMGLTSSTAYAGIFGTHRNGSTPVTYTFDRFYVTL